MGENIPESGSGQCLGTEIEKALDTHSSVGEAKEDIIAGHLYYAILNF
jgi:hypothetical protein